MGSSRRWVIDPIDGTAGLTRGSPVWATLIALQVDEKTNVAVVSAPDSSEFGGRPQVRGHGPRALRRTAPSSRPDSAASHRWTRWEKRTSPFPALELGGARQAYRAHRTHPTGPLDRGFGDFWSHMLVAEGYATFPPNPRLRCGMLPRSNSWSVKPVGRVTALDGTSDGPGFLCTNGRLHEEVVDVLQGDADPLPLATRIDQLEEGTRP